MVLVVIEEVVMAVEEENGKGDHADAFPSGFDKELSEGNKRLKRAKDSGSRRWQYSSVVRGKFLIRILKTGSSFVNEVSTSGRTNESDHEVEEGLEQFPGFPGQLVSYPLGSNAFREFYKAKAAVERKWGVKSTVERKESLLDKVAEEETKLELILEEHGLSKKKRVDSRLNKTPGTESSAQLNPIKPSKVAQLFPKKWMLKTLPASGTTGSGEVANDKRRKVKPSGESGEKVVEGRSASVDDLKEVEERARLAILQGEEDTSQMVAHLIKGMWPSIEEEKSVLKKAKSKLEIHLARAKTEAMKEGYSEEMVDAIKVDTYVEVEDEEAEVVVREMSLRINDLESELAIKRETSEALLSTQAELHVRSEWNFRLVELDSSRARENNILMCNREFAELFDRMKEANKNREDQYVKVHFRLEKLNQAIFNLTLQVEVKDSEIKKGLEELTE
ncbi:hypothetical protein GIB67_037925, partial [Kingdonia uniflora]